MRPRPRPINPSSDFKGKRMTAQSFNVGGYPRTASHKSIVSSRQDLIEVPINYPASHGAIKYDTKSILEKALLPSNTSLDSFADIKEREGRKDQSKEIAELRQELGERMQDIKELKAILASRTANYQKLLEEKNLKIEELTSLLNKPGIQKDRNPYKDYFNTLKGIIQNNCINMYEALAKLKEKVSDISTMIPSFKKEINNKVKVSLKMLKLLTSQKEHGSSIGFELIERIRELESINASKEEELNKALRELQQLRRTYEFSKEYEGEFINPGTSHKAGFPKYEKM